jgi:hypothetical protein
MPVNNIEYDAFRNFNLIILNELNSVPSGLADELKVFAEAGGSLFVIPGTSIDQESYAAFLQGVGSDIFRSLIENENRVDYLEWDHPVYRDVFERRNQKAGENLDLPVTKSYYSISNRPGTGMVTLMRLQNRQPFLKARNFGKGSIYLLAVPLNDDYSNFHRHAMFVPTLFNIGLLSAATIPLYYTIGEEEIIEYVGERPQGDDVFMISGREEDFEFIPEIRLLNKRINLIVHDQIDKAGQYDLRQNGDVLLGLSFNYDRRESALDYLTTENIESMASESLINNFNILENTGKPVDEAIEEMKSGRQLWRLFIILALAFLATEIILLRFWR